MSPTTTGGSSATDFQPTTRNPQGNVGGGLQPNSTTLQPTTSSGDSNVFNLPGVNAQAFPQTTSLRVLSTGSQIQPGTNPRNTTDPVSQGWGMLTIFFVAIAVVAIILFVMVKVAKPVHKTEEILPEVPQTSATPGKAKKKFKKKKKTAKNRK